MEFGINFFPDVQPAEKSAARYFTECLEVVRMLEPRGYTHIRIVEHYFRAYSGYSPNPMLFLAAAAMCTKNIRLITGAVLPAFNHPLKLAGEAGMLDALSGGRLEIGFARAFLPHEFERFGIEMDSSRDRFEEGVDAVVDLLEREKYPWMENSTHFRPRHHCRGQRKDLVRLCGSPLSAVPRGSDAPANEDSESWRTR